MRVKVFYEKISNLEESINSWLALDSSITILRLDTCYDNGYVLATIVYDTAR